MKKNTVYIYSLFAVIIYIFSVTFFCASLYKEFSEGDLKSDEEFNILVTTPPGL